MRIIDTTSDLGFKTVFGEKPHLLMSLLNNFLPLKYPIVEITYLTPEIIPDLQDGKNSIVDVRCRDKHDRHFIVEMQIGKQSSFLKRALLNTSKVYSRQLGKDQHFKGAQPVYSLNILNHRIDQNEKEWYHHYAMTNQMNINIVLDEIHIVLIELPKWKKLNKFDLELPRDRWLVYFTEPNYFTMLTKEELKRFNEISEAIEVLEPTNLSPERIRAYELYLDNIRVRESNIAEAKEEGIDITLAVMEDLKDPSKTIEFIADKYNISQKKVRDIAAWMSRTK